MILTEQYDANYWNNCVDIVLYTNSGPFSILEYTTKLDKLTIWI